MSSMFHKVLVVLVLASLLLAVVFSFIPQSRAADGISVAPFMTEVQLEPGVVQTKIITVTNNTAEPVTLSVTASDFAPSENGQPQFPNAAIVTPNTYSLMSWVTVRGSSTFTLSPGSQRDVVVELAPPVLVEPGTRYGALLFTSTTPPVAGQSRVVQSIASLLVARYGQGLSQGYIADLSTTSFFTEVAPVTFRTRFTNSGTVHVRPKGELRITNMFGREVAREMVNRDAAIVLPSSDRVFTTTWIPNRAFGHYTAELRLYYGDNRLEATRTVSFWILPLGWVIVSVVMVIALVVGLLLALRYYKRWLLARHQK
jgi:hypothetical protein